MAAREDYHFSGDRTPGRDLYLRARLHEFNKRYVQGALEQVSEYCLSASGDLIGGVAATVVWNWLHVDHMWVDEGYRGSAIGQTLLRSIEAKAIEKRCAHVQIDTFDFQAPDFYRRLGYTELARLEGYAGGHTRYFFVKSLDSGER